MTEYSILDQNTLFETENMYCYIFKREIIKFGLCDDISPTKARYAT